MSGPVLSKKKRERQVQNEEKQVLEGPSIREPKTTTKGALSARNHIEHTRSPQTCIAKIQINSEREHKHNH